MGWVVAELIQGIESACSIDELVHSLQRAIECFGFSGFSFVDAGRPHLDKPYFLSTTGKSWEDEYQHNGFVHVDPALSLARRNNAPFPWSRIKLEPRLGKRKPGSHHLMEAAADHGFRNGYVFPFHFVDKLGRVYSTVNGLFWKDRSAELDFLLSTEKRYELDLVMMYWTQRVIDVAGKELREGPTFADLSEFSGNSPRLTDREREVLTWAARGHTVADTSDVLKIGQETVQTYIQNVIMKMGATNKTHAVAKAIRLGLIDV